MLFDLELNQALGLKSRIVENKKTNKQENGKAKKEQRLVRPGFLLVGHLKFSSQTLDRGSEQAKGEVSIRRTVLN